MGSRRLPLPSQRNYEYGYDLAYKLACEQLAKINDIKQQCHRSGAQYLETDSQKVITLKYLNREYQITLPNVAISLVDSQEEVPVRDKVLILHYFTQAKGTPITNKMITFKELPEGANYFPSFAKRTIKPLLGQFGQESHQLVDAAAKLGGYKVEYGDVAITIDAFRYVPLTLIFWRGDEEFDPSASIIFDATISDYLSTEDIAVLCQTMTWKLIRYSKEITPD
jgi:hypothetical protein